MPMSDGRATRSCHWNASGLRATSHVAVPRRPSRVAPEAVPAAVVGERAERLHADGRDDEQRSEQLQRREALGQEEQEQRPGGREQARAPGDAGGPAADRGHRRDVRGEGEPARGRQQAARLRLVPEARRAPRAQGLQQAGQADERHGREDERALGRGDEQRERAGVGRRRRDAGGREREADEAGDRARGGPAQQGSPGAAPAHDDGGGQHQRQRDRGRLQRARQRQRQAGAGRERAVVVLLGADEQPQRQRDAGGRWRLSGPRLRGRRERRPERQREGRPARVVGGLAARHRGEQRRRRERREGGREQLADDGGAGRVQLEAGGAGQGEHAAPEPAGRAVRVGQADRPPVGHEQGERGDEHEERRGGPGPRRAPPRQRAGGLDADAHYEAARRRWYRFTARLCSARVSLNWWVPSFRLTKYSSFVGAGSMTARIASRPGQPIGPGGRPA